MAQQTSKQATHPGFTAANGENMQANHLEGLLTSQALLTQGVRLLNGHDDFGKTPGLVPAAPSFAPTSGFRPTHQDYPTSRPTPQALATSYWQGNTPQTYQGSQPAPSRILVPEIINGHGFSQPPRQIHERRGIASHYLPTSFQGFQNEHLVNPSADHTPRNSTHRSIMTEQVSNYAAYNTQSQTHLTYTVYPNGYQPFTESRPSHGGPNFRGEAPPRRKWVSSTDAKSEQYETAQILDTAHANIASRPGVGPDSTESYKPEQTHSEAELRAIQEAVGQAVVLLATEESPAKSNPPQLPGRPAAQEADSALSTPRSEWNDHANDPTRSQIFTNDVPEEIPQLQQIELDQTSNQASSSSSSEQSPASTKRRRGRPTKEEQMIRDQADPERARLREEKKAAKKAAKEAAKPISSKRKEKQKGNSVKMGFSTIKISDSDEDMSGPEQDSSPVIKIEDNFEEEDLYSADGEKQKIDSSSAQAGLPMTRKRAATTGLESLSKVQKSMAGDNISNTEHDRAQSEGAVSISSFDKRLDNSKAPVRESERIVRQPVSSSSMRQSRTERCGSSQGRSRSGTVVDDRAQTGLPGSVNNPLDFENLNDDAVPIVRDVEPLHPPVMVLPLPAQLARTRMIAYFGREYCQQHDIREIERSRIYHSSTPVRQFPDSITHFLTCSETVRVQPRRATLPRQVDLCVIPNKFGSFTNAQFTTITTFIRQANRVNSKLLIACSSDNAFESAVIEGLVVMASVLAKKTTNPRKRKLLDDLDFFLQCGRGSHRWNGATNQWKEFVDAIGNINKRRNGGPKMEYIEVQDFKDILSAVPEEPTAIELELPVPFNKRTLAKQVLDWWEAQDSEYVPREFSRTKLQELSCPEKFEPEKELWPVLQGDTEDEGYQEAVIDDESMDPIYDWALVI
ncbi:hypothetical protein DL98DRAFT_534842 [Cadophora sp. DSE1049]|nr:hypothetical protein DL98DRAFT_534842 [Cadophora sp. DSE1049]